MATPMPTRLSGQYPLLDPAQALALAGRPPANGLPPHTGWGPVRAPLYPAVHPQTARRATLTLQGQGVTTSGVSSYTVSASGVPSGSLVLSSGETVAFVQQCALLLTTPDDALLDVAVSVRQVDPLTVSPLALDPTQVVAGLSIRGTEVWVALGHRTATVVLYRLMLHVTTLTGIWDLFWPAISGQAALA